MCRSFSTVNQRQAPYRCFPNVTQEKQSSFPPAKCRSEWQDNVYVVSNTMLTSSTSVPSPIPNFPFQLKATNTSFHKKNRNTTAIYKKYRCTFCKMKGNEVSPRYFRLPSLTAHAGGSRKNAR